MKETLKDRILKDLSDIRERMSQLNLNIQSYVKMGNYVEAGVCKIKYNTLELVEKRLSRSVADG